MKCSLETAKSPFDIRKMASNKLQTPASYDSDSDEAPEVVTKQTAEQQVEMQRQQELEAREQAKAAKKKRKNKQESKEKSEEVAQLPEDVLSVVAARDEEEAAEEQAQQEEKRADKRRAKKQAKLLQKKMHTRQFGNIQVQTLQALEQTQARDLTASAKEFLDRRFAPKRERMDLLKGHDSQFTKKQKQRI